jgi:PKD repeat protein
MLKTLTFSKSALPRWTVQAAFACCMVQAASSLGQIIPATRTVDWSPSSVGVPGGIPHRTTIYTTLSSGATEAQIQAAITACPSNQVVFLGPGTYSIAAGLNFAWKSGVTLRGSGTSTVLASTGGGCVITLGANSLWNNSLYPRQWDAGTTIVSGCTKGSTNLVLSSLPSLAVGQLLLVDENDDTSFVVDGTGATPRAMSQTVVLQAINGTTITTWPPLSIDFSTSLDARVKTLGSPSYQNNFSGIEDLKIDGSGSGAATMGIEMEQCYACWLSNVVLSLVPNYHVTMQCAARLSIVRCSCLNVPVHGPNHYGLGLESSTSSSLIQDCIVYGIFPGIEVNYGCSGNVIAYNFVWDVYQDNFGQGAGIDIDHGPHNVMNLLEGNVTDMIQSDGYFGSSSHNTLLRNWCSGWGPTYTNVNSKCVSLNRWAWYFNVVGNVLGMPGIEQEYQRTANGDNLPAIFQFGYPNMGNNSYNGLAPPNTWNNPGSGSGDNQWLDLMVQTNILLGGNWDVVNKSVVWSAAVPSQTIPASFYLSGKPAWFGGLNWPPFDPATANAAMFSPTNIPAGYRYVFGADPPGGSGGGSQPPVAVASAAPLAGAAPVAVTFSSAGSYSPGSLALTYSWTFGDGATSTAANPSHTYQSAGTYSAQLSVSDGTSTTPSSILTIQAMTKPAAPTNLRVAGSSGGGGGGGGSDLLSAMNPNFVWLSSTLASGNVSAWTDLTNGARLTAYSSAAYPTNSLSAGGGVWFSGNGSCYLTNAGLALSGSGNWTLAFRAQFPSASVNDGAVVSNVGDNPCIDLGNGANPHLVVYYPAFYSATMASGVWYSIMMACSSGSWNCWTNGVLATSGTGLSTWSLQCVGDNPSNDPYLGYIQKFVVWTNAAKTITDAANWNTYCSTNNP